MNYFEDECFTIENLKDIDSFSGCEFISCEFKNIDISEKDLRHAKFIECEFVNCNLSNINILSASFRDVKFKNSKCIGVNFSECNTLFELNFDECILDYSSFENVKLNKSNFINSSFRSSVLTEGSFIECDFSHSNFLNAILNRANFKSSNFKGAINYQIDVTSTNVNGCRFSIPEVLELLTPFGVIID